MGNSVKKAVNVLKATNPITKPGEHTKMVLDPGGLFHTSDNPDVAEHQARLDVGGFGAKATLAEREAEKAMASQAEEVNKQAADAQRLLDERRARMARKQKGRGSLLTGTERGIELKTTLG